MTIPRRALRIVLAVISFIVLMLFSNVSAIVLVALIAGAVAIILGIDFAYKPVSILGLLMVASGVSASVEITSLTEIRMIVTAVVALLIPVFVLAWTTLTSDEEPAGRSNRRAIWWTIGYVVVCLVSVPLVATVLGILAPQLSTNLSTMMGIAVLLLVVVILGIALTFKEPRIQLTESAEKESAAG